MCLGSKMSILDPFIMIARVLLIFFCFNSLSMCSKVDKNGYIIYCPCMGRFGNQAEQFLGSLIFAKYLDRTLVLPPFIEYRNYQVEFSPFDKFFKLEPLKRYHKVILIEDFMTNVAPKVWLEDERFILCYGPRKGDNDQVPDCNPFDGSPFKPFWHHFNITRFKSSIFHQPLITQFNEAKFWKETYKDLKVLAFVGAPSSFPTNQEAIPLQKYLHFSDSIADSAAKYREVRGFTGKPYLGVHLRHGSDWIKACSLLKENEMNQLFSSDQCVRRDGVDLTEFKLPYELCSHSVNTIVEDINHALSDVENTHQLEVVYIATDYDDQSVWQEIHAKLPEVTLITPTTTYVKNNITRSYSQPHYIIDTYLLSYSNYFIGNCVSSFSAFASRVRLHSFHFDRTTRFFADDLLHTEKLLKDEL